MPGVPFPNYSLDIIGDGQFRLSLPPEFAAQPGLRRATRRELAQGCHDQHLRRLSRHALHGSCWTPPLPEPWSYEQTGVALIQERDGVEAMTSHGLFRASSHEATRWTLLHKLRIPFADAKALLPLLKSGIGNPA